MMTGVLVQICEKAYPGGWSLNWAAQQKVPFAFLGNQWVGFENTESVRIKVSAGRGNLF